MAEVWINVAAYMSGHNHKGNYAHHKGCHDINFKGMVETETTSAYAVVRCFADRIANDGFESEPDRKLAWCSVLLLFGHSEDVESVVHERGEVAVAR